MTIPSTPSYNITHMLQNPAPQPSTCHTQHAAPPVVAHLHDSDNDRVAGLITHDTLCKLAASSFTSISTLWHHTRLQGHPAALLSWRTITCILSSSACSYNHSTASLLPSSFHSITLIPPHRLVYTPSHPTTLHHTCCCVLGGDVARHVSTGMVWCRKVRGVLRCVVCCVWYVV